MGSLLSKMKRRNEKSSGNIRGGEDMSSKNIFINIENHPTPSPPESPMVGLKCNHVFLKTKCNPQPNLCSKCGFIIKSPNQVLKRIGAENKRKEELKLKLRTQMHWENERNVPDVFSVQGQGNEEFDMCDSFIEYPPIEPGRIPLASLSQNHNRKSDNLYRFQQRSLKTQDESYFLQKSNPKFMTNRSEKPKVQYSLHDEF